MYKSLSDIAQEIEEDMYREENFMFRDYVKNILIEEYYINLERKYYGNREEM